MSFGKRLGLAVLILVLDTAFLLVPLCAIFLVYVIMFRPPAFKTWVAQLYGEKHERKVEKTDAEWKKKLTPEQFEVTRKKGTEQAFTGTYYECKEKGMYHCVCCGAELFSSDAKFDSGTGWPSFYAPAQTGNIEEESDQSHGMNRTEVLCKNCGAHLGHVFPDGPAPTGQRYCINSGALKLDKKNPST